MCVCVCVLCGSGAGISWPIDAMRTMSYVSARLKT